jgi:site-specific DNA recombinase
MGGPIPLGYDVCDRKLVINEAEAEIVRTIFRRFLELGTVVATVYALNQEGFRTKATQSSEGRARGGNPWSRGALAHLLANRVYIGETRHKHEHFAGEHLPIVDSMLWEAVQSQLAKIGFLG